jgi:molecular chaperone GrpE (heat shock protein)
MKDWFSNLINPRRESDVGENSLPETAGQESPIAAEAKRPGEQAELASVDILALQKEVQALRIEIETREDNIANLKQEIERLRLRQDQLITETVAARLSGLFNDVAAPSSQILTQADLLERQGKPVQARDVLAVARRMVRALERYGVAFVGQVGEQVPFDPNLQTLINGAALPQPGQPVTVRFAGVTYQGKILYKAIVE